MAEKKNQHFWINEKPQDTGRMQHKVDHERLVSNTDNDYDVCEREAIWLQCVSSVAILIEYFSTFIPVLHFFWSALLIIKSPATVQ